MAPSPFWFGLAPGLKLATHALTQQLLIITSHSKWIDSIVSHHLRKMDRGVTHWTYQFLLYYFLFDINEYSRHVEQANYQSVLEK